MFWKLVGYSKERFVGNLECIFTKGVEPRKYLTDRKVPEDILLASKYLKKNARFAAYDAQLTKSEKELLTAFCRGVYSGLQAIELQKEGEATVRKLLALGESPYKLKRQTLWQSQLTEIIEGVVSELENFVTFFPKNLLEKIKTRTS